MTYHLNEMEFTEHESDYYGSEYLADYYESLWTGHPALKDVDVYWEFCKRHLSSHSQSNPFTLLDVGTGTGRVIHALIEKATADPSIDISSTRFIGMDKSQFMLNLANKRRKRPQGFNELWLLGTATALDQLEPLVHPHPKIDVLIFAFSGINHLYMPREVDEFFSSVRKVLKPGGLALVSVCTPLLDVTETHIENPFGEVKEVRSKSIEGTLYRERGIDQRIEGDLFINSMTIEVWRTNTDGSEQVIESNDYNIPLRLLTHEQLQTSISSSGLWLLDEKQMGEEIIFVIKLGEK